MHFHNHIRVILSLDFVLSCLSCSIRISIYILGSTGLPLLIGMYHLTYVSYYYSKPKTYSSTYCTMDGMHQEVFDSVTPL